MILTPMAKAYAVISTARRLPVRHIDWQPLSKRFSMLAVNRMDVGAKQNVRAYVIVAF